MKVSKTSN